MGLGEEPVQSWSQIGEDVFGNALGNALGVPIAEHERRWMDRERSAAMAYAMRGADGGAMQAYAGLRGYPGADPLDGYDPSDYPMLAAVGDDAVGSVSRSKDKERDGIETVSLTGEQRALYNKYFGLGGFAEGHWNVAIDYNGDVTAYLNPMQEEDGKQQMRSGRGCLTIQGYW